MVEIDRFCYIEWFEGSTFNLELKESLFVVDEDTRITTNVVSAACVKMGRIIDNLGSIDRQTQLLLGLESWKDETAYMSGSIEDDQLDHFKTFTGPTRTGHERSIRVPSSDWNKELYYDYDLAAVASRLTYLVYVSLVLDGRDWHQVESYLFKRVKIDQINIPDYACRSNYIVLDQTEEIYLKRYSLKAILSYKSDPSAFLVDNSAKVITWSSDAISLNIKSKQGAESFKGYTPCGSAYFSGEKTVTVCRHLGVDAFQFLNKTSLSRSDLKLITESIKARRSFSTKYAINLFVPLLSLLCLLFGYFSYVIKEIEVRRRRREGVTAIIYSLTTTIALYTILKELINKNEESSDIITLRKPKRKLSSLVKLNRDNILFIISNRLLAGVVSSRYSCLLAPTDHGDVEIDVPIRYEILREAGIIATKQFLITPSYGGARIYEMKQQGSGLYHMTWGPVAERKISIVLSDRDIIGF